MKILISCGGSAGHIFPGLALIEQLKKEKTQHDIVIVVSDRSRDKQFLGTAHFPDIPVERIFASALPYRFSLKYFVFIFKLLAAFLQSCYILCRHRPEVAVGFGGSASFAPLFCAKLFGIPTLIHEQNLRPGRANQILARVADRVAISFNDTEAFFQRPGLKSKLVRTGYPLRSHILNAGVGGKSPQQQFTVLIVGGSQGAQRINKLVLASLARLDQKIKRQLRLVHLTGKKDLEPIRSAYISQGLDFEVFDFLKDISPVYARTDLLISRSGAGTIFEAARFGLPCLFIPHSGGTAHQLENARYLEDQGAALVLDEQTTTARDLAEMISGLIAQQSRRDRLSDSIQSYKDLQAGLKLIGRINELFQKKYA
ncbi:glycosyltransferase [Candidatus Omnitrophota bacterium]